MTAVTMDVSAEPADGVDEQLVRQLVDRARAEGPGHASIQTTLRYKAIYPTEAIEAHRAFIARRRATRPGEEYRTPTDEGMGRLPRPLREAESLHRHLRTRLRNTLRP